MVRQQDPDSCAAMCPCPASQAPSAPPMELDADPLSERPDLLGDVASVHGHSEVAQQREESEIDVLADHRGPGMLMH
jgi:hypothetical protein